MSSTEVKEIIYHCECRRFVPGTPEAPCFCHACGREHASGVTNQSAQTAAKV